MRALLAYDGSAGSILAASTVGSLAWPAETAIRVVASLPSQSRAGSSSLGGDDQAPVGFEAQVASELRSDLANVARRLHATGARTEIDVLRGRPADTILGDAATFQADLLVLGSRGHGSVASLVLGSVSAEVVDRSPAPVLVARGPAVSRVLLAIDRSPGARVAEDLLRTWSIFDNLPIRVVSLDADSPTWTEAVNSKSESAVGRAAAGDPARDPVTNLEFARQSAARLTAAGRAADSVLRVGEPAAAIIRAAEQWNADLVVLGSSGRSGLARLLPGSVVRHVLHGAQASVLIARAPIAPARPDKST